jgi:hypothetical protein
MEEMHRLRTPTAEDGPDESAIEDGLRNYASMFADGWSGGVAGWGRYGAPDAVTAMFVARCVRE